MKEIGLINRFSEKKFLFGEMGHFGPKIAHPHNSGSAVRIFFKILPNEEGQ